MQAFKCDRCGTFYTDSAIVRRVTIYKSLKNGPLDICPECQDLVLKLLKCELPYKEFCKKIEKEIDELKRSNKE